MAMFARPSLVRMIFDKLVAAPSNGHYVLSPHIIVAGAWMMEDTRDGRLFHVHRPGSPGMPALHNLNSAALVIAGGVV